MRIPLGGRGPAAPRGASVFRQDEAERRRWAGVGAGDAARAGAGAVAPAPAGVRGGAPRSRCCGCPPGRAASGPAGSNSRCGDGWRPVNTGGAAPSGAGCCRPGGGELPVPARLAAVQHRWCGARLKRSGLRSAGGAVHVGSGVASAPAGGASRAGPAASGPAGRTPGADTAGGRPARWCCARRQRSGVRVRGRASRAGTAGCRTGVVPCARKRSGIRVRGRASRAGTAGCRTGVVPCAPVRASRAGGWCSSGRCGRARAGWCLSRCGRARTGWCWGRCGPARAGVVLVGAGVAWAVPASGYAGENRWSLIRRAAPMTPAVGPNSPRTMGRLPVAKGSDPR